MMNYPKPEDMYQLLVDLVAAQEASRSVPSPSVMAVIAEARDMIHKAEYGQRGRDAVGHTLICQAADVFNALPYPLAPHAGL